MPFEQLLQERKILPHRPTGEEIEQVMALAERDIRMARRTMGEDWD